MIALLFCLQELAKRTSRNDFTTPTHILDLNYHCLREIFQYLDLATQYSLLQTSNKFSEVILYDIWYRNSYYEFDMSKDQSIYSRPRKFQIDCMELFLSKFTKIKGIRPKLFKRFLENNLAENDYKHVISLNIQNPTIKYADKSNILNMTEFLKFSNLQELYLENVKIKFDTSVNLHFLKTFSLTAYKIHRDTKGNFLNNILSKNLEKLELKPLRKRYIALAFENISKISHCINLKELTLYSYHISDRACTYKILALPHLTSLTIQSYSYYFSFKDQKLFNLILKLLYKSLDRSLEAFEMHGIPDRSLFLCEFLEDVPNLSWIVTKFFHLQVNGYLEWKPDIDQIVKSFDNFMVNSKYLRNVFVGNNIFHKERVNNELNFVEEIQQIRCDKGYDKLKFIDNIDENSKFQHFNKSAEGSVRFFIK